MAWSTATIASLSANDLERVGAGAALLGELARRGIEVPDGFVVSGDGPVPAPSLVRTAYADLCALSGQLDAAVAVRSLQAGGPWRLNVRGADAVANAVDDAIAGFAGPCLVVQLPWCESSGTVATDLPGLVVVESQWGAPTDARSIDRFTVDKDTLAILAVAITHKTSEQVPHGPDGVQSRALPSRRQDAPSLTHEEASRLAEIAREAERILARPVALQFAVEWVRDLRRIRILDAQPATATLVTAVAKLP